MIDPMTRIAVSFAVVCVTASSTGLLLAFSDLFSPAATLALSVILAILVLRWRAQWAPLNQGFTFKWSRWGVVEVAAAFGWAFWILQKAGSPIFLNRDPGSYFSTALTLNNFGGLSIDVGDHALHGAPGVNFIGPASYFVSGSILEFQFEHGASVLYALSAWAFGPPLISIASTLAFIVGGVALVRTMFLIGIRRSIAWGSTSAFMISIPVVYSARSTYSEPFVFMMLAVAALTFAIWYREDRPQSFLVLPGLLVGSTCLFRVDGLLYVGVVLIALTVGHPIVQTRGRAWSAVGLLPGFVIGTIDHWWWTGNYARDLERSYRPLAALLIAATLAVVTLSVLVKWRQAAVDRLFSASGSKLLAATASGLTFLSLWFLMFWRPLLFPSKKSSPGLSPSQSLIAGLQQRSGAVIDSSREYSEYSLTNFAWYFGLPLAIAAVVGIALVAYMAVRNSGPSRLAFTVIVLASAGYTYRLYIFPDQPWATRRLLPFILPTMLVLGAFALSKLTDRITDRVMKSVSTTLCVLLCIVPALLAILPVRGMTDQSGGARAVQTICEYLRPESDVVLIGSPKLIASIRGTCGVNVASIDDSQQLLAVIEESRTCESIDIIGSHQNFVEEVDREVELIGSVSTSLGQMPFQTLDTPVSSLDGEKFFETDVFRIKCAGETS